MDGMLKAGGRGGGGGHIKGEQSKCHVCEQWMECKGEGGGHIKDEQSKCHVCEQWMECKGAISCRG